MADVVNLAAVDEPGAVEYFAGLGAEGVRPRVRPGV